MKTAQIGRYLIDIAIIVEIGFVVFISGNHSDLNSGSSSQTIENLCDYAVSPSEFARPYFNITCTDVEQQTIGQKVDGIFEVVLYE